MKILYLVYVQQNTFKSFCNDHKTGCSWVDALLDEIPKCKNINIAIGVPANEKTLQKYQKEAITLYGLPNPVETNTFLRILNRFTRPIEDFQIINYASQVIKDYNPDIVQIFGSENPFGLIAKQQSKPVIIHIQGYLLVWLGKWFAGITKLQQIRYDSFKNLVLKQGNYHGFIDFKKRAERESIIVKNCKYYMGRTSFDKRIISLISPGSKYYHCEEFIRKEFFEKQWNFKLKNEVTCISILKGTFYKGIDLLVEALIILKKFSTFSFKFNICGVSENEEIIKILKKKYKKEIDSLNIRFLGKLTSDELIEQLCNSNFYIHPSYIENSPNSVCEAMALGLPIISTNVGGVSSIIDDKIEGLLVQEGEPYSLAGAIMELSNNYEYAMLLGKNARIKALQRHNTDEILKQILKIYELVLLEDERKKIS